MLEFFTKLLDTQDFLPRWQCGNWSDALGWLHVLSDVAIFAAYASIPILLVFFVIRRRDTPFLPIFWLFAMFILACGIGHLVEATVFWQPWYRLSGLIKVITACVSWVTVIALIPTIPRALALPGLAAVNSRLKQEIIDRDAIEQELREQSRKLACSHEELQRSAAELAKSNQLVRLIIEASSSGMALVGHDGKIIMVNSRLEETFGYRRDELLGQPIEILMSADIRAKHVELRRQFMRQPRSPKMGEGRDLHGRHKDGRVIPVEVGLNPVQFASNMCVLADVVDITHRKRIENEIKEANEALRGNNEELEQFAYVASHDLQEPLRKVASFCGLLHQEYSEKLDGEAVTYLNYAVDGATRMQRLIRDLLHYSRVQSEGHVATEVSVATALDEALCNLPAAIEESGAIITSDDLPWVWAGERQLVQLLQNLISNAIKYRGDEIPRIHVGVDSDDHQLVISVRDNGIGIAAEYHERIFGIFKRLHDRSQYEGTGIGLAICRRIVDRMGGKMWVESEEGVGSTFFFTLRKAPRNHGMENEINVPSHAEAR